MFQAFVNTSLPKSSQASYLPERHAVYGHDFAIDRFWTSIVGFAVCEITCWRADFNASDIVYVTDVLVTFVLLQCNPVFAMHLGHGSQSTRSFGFTRLCSRKTVLNHHYLRVRKQVTFQKVIPYMTTILLLLHFGHSLLALLFGR